MSKEKQKEEAHNKLNEDILEAVFDSMDDLEPPHVVFIGIHLFADIAYETCKDKQKGLEYVLDILKDVWSQGETEVEINLEAEEVPNVVH